MILCASIVWPSSHAKVTSVKSLSFRNLPKAELTFSLKSFYCRQSFSDIIMRRTVKTSERVCTKNRMMIMIEETQIFRDKDNSTCPLLTMSTQRPCLSKPLRGRKTPALRILSTWRKHYQRCLEWNLIIYFYFSPTWKRHQKCSESNYYQETFSSVGSQADHHSGRSPRIVQCRSSLSLVLVDNICGGW